jgi:hypothetical protein
LHGHADAVENPSEVAGSSLSWELMLRRHKTSAFDELRRDVSTVAARGLIPHDRIVEHETAFNQREERGRELNRSTS